MTEAHAAEQHASEQAEHAARAAGVTVVNATGLADLEAVVALFDRIWRSEGNPTMSTEVLRALAKAGNYVGVAHADGVMVGACVGFFAAPADRTLHSHIAGVLPGAARHGVGYALKLHQRAWALRQGIGTIEWTFDPIVARNAYFNLVKLGARPVEYLTNFYGGMHDGINTGDDTDRLLVRWELAAPEVVAACSARQRSPETPDSPGSATTVALGRGPAGEPVIGSTDGRRLLVAMPADVEKLRVSDPALATAWRYAVRKVLADLMADGARPCAATRDGWYVLDTTNDLNHTRGEANP